LTCAGACGAAIDATPTIINTVKTVNAVNDRDLTRVIAVLLRS
jgi:hypothetical protein